MGGSPRTPAGERDTPAPGADALDSKHSNASNAGRHVSAGLCVSSRKRTEASTMQGDSVPSSTGLSAEELELLAYLLEEEGVSVDDQHTIAPRAPDAEMPLSFAQERLWFLDQWDPGTPAYNIPFAVRLTGNLVVEAFQRSLDEIVRRHEALRTTFADVEGRPLQVIAPPSPFPLTMLDLRHIPHDQHEAEVQRLISENALHRFDLARGPLIRAELVQLDEHAHVFLLNIHHIVFDAWSVGLFLRELTILYDAFANGQPSPLPEPIIQYPDFSIWQRTWLQGDVLQEQLNYWRRQMSGSLPILELPGDRPRPAVLTYTGTLAYRLIPHTIAEKLGALCQEENATMFMVVLAAFQTLLYRYSGEEDIITGSLIANRDFVDIEGLMGFFVNTLLLRTDQSGNPTFREFLGRVREITLEAYAHQNVPFEQLVEELKPVRDTSHTPLFQVMFILQNAPVPSRAQHDLQVDFLRIDNGTSKFDLTLSMTEAPDGLRTVAEYKTDLFDASTIERMLGHYEALLEGIVQDPDRRLSELPLLTEAERGQLLTWNQQQVPFSEGACAHQLFEAQAARTPEAPALEWEGQRLSYRELNERANRVAHHLRAIGVRPAQRVGLSVERSFELVVGLLGILKAGAAYVPLDPTYPPERLLFMVEDAGVRVLLTRENGPTPWFSGTAVDLAADWPLISRQPASNPGLEIGPEQLAYVIYTSGSVGLPKGVLVEHRSLVNYTEAAREAYGVGEGDRVLQFASISFDASAEEIYTALTGGATLVLRSEQMLETVETFLRICTQWQISVLSLPTAFWHELVARMAAEGLALPETLRLLIIGGERALPERVALWQQHVGGRVRLLNTYGPTEATVVATLFPVPAEPSGETQREVPIGRPLRNLAAYVLDRSLAPVPVGVPGELCIGGAGLARGYLGRPELTAERFVPNPFAERLEARDVRLGDSERQASSLKPLASRLYRTGDLVRWLPDGTLEFLGRVDHQVKIRGFRIELGEVETALRQSPLIAEAVVAAREDQPGDKRLIAYIVPQDGKEPTTGELRSFLRTRLPDYMLPTAYVPLERLPLTSSGKVNMRALPPPDSSRLEIGGSFVAPRTPTEEQIAELWKSVLKLERVGVYDNFFELGGHSLLATQLIARLRATFQVDLPIRHLFGAPTVAGVAEMIDTIRWVAQGAAVTAASGDDDLDEGEL
ncbi:MAG TPA: amino acid adenylation domain-containing protein [Roseiflexaceae bacterium]|nr:amino acid adenylation domain-containing protein [Roseiflexaceae bacterium]